MSMRTSRKMKGQNLVFEQVMLFLIGVLIFIICYSIFSSYQSSYTVAGTDNQLKQVSSYLSLAVIRLSESPNNTATLYLEVPKDIGGEVYRMKLTKEGINVTLLSSGKNILSTLAGINQTINLSGSSVVSTAGAVTLYKNSNNIRLA
jgi:hypothetical protein